MHLWPSLKLRNSFKSNSRRRFQNESNQQRLLGGNKEETSPAGFAVVCIDVAMVLSCCYCCFCCGACIDEEET